MLVDDRLKNLMHFIQEWAKPYSGGDSGELHLLKVWRDGQWVIEVKQIHPTSTWHIGT